MLPYRNLWEGRDLCGRTCAPHAGPNLEGKVEGGGPPRTVSTVRFPSVHPGGRCPPPPSPSRQDRVRGAGDRKELCIKTLYVRSTSMSTTSELCAERLTPARDVGFYSLSLQRTRAPGQLEGGCRRIVLPCCLPPAALVTATSIVVSHGSVARAISLYGRSAGPCGARGSVRKPLPPSTRRRPVIHRSFLDRAPLSIPRRTRAWRSARRVTSITRDGNRLTIT